MPRSRSKRRRALSADSLPAVILWRSVELDRPPAKWTKAHWQHIAIELAWKLSPRGIINEAWSAPPLRRKGRPPLFKSDEEALRYYKDAMWLYRKSGLPKLEAFFERKRCQFGDGRPSKQDTKQDAEQLRNIGRALKRKGLI